jgi:Transmembrane domain of unknown function (DUF3566)
LDRLTNTPDGSGGAFPTVTASRQDDDLMADHDQDTQPAGAMAAPPGRTPATPAAMPAAAGKDASANGGPAAEDNGQAARSGADLSAEAPPALPADSIGTPRDSSAFSFTRQASAPASPGAEDAKPAEPGHAPTAEAPVPAGQDTASPIDRAMFRPASVTEPAAEAPSPTVPAGPEPSPAAVSAAAFAWEPPDPPPTSPSSPAQNFLRSSGNAAAAPESAAARPTAAPAGQAAAPDRSTSRKKAAQRPVRQAHLTVARVEPWSVMKFSFVMSLVAFVILFVAVTVLYGTLSALGVFESLQRVVTSVTSSQDSAGVNAARWFSASRVLGYTGLLGSLDIVLITAIATLGAVIYNLTSRLIGGVEVTLRETD